jgi:predicted dehydrogenase
MSKISIGIVGFGEFSISYLDLWLKHPNVKKVVGAEILEDRRNQIKEKYGIKMYSSYDEMLEKEEDLTAVAIFSQRHMHGPMVIQALKQGKHVFSAVPMGITEDEVFEILDLVKKTRLTYMMAETCYYFPCAVWCRDQYKKGRFGKFVYGESQYYHDIADMFRAFESNGDGWKRVAGIPPMYYSTHSMSMLFSAIDDYPVDVTCFGYVDTQGDGIYGKGNNEWDNPFSNETAILRTKKGGIARINEFRRCGNVRPTSYITGLYGDTGAYEGSGNQHLFSRNDAYNNQEFTSEDVSSQINTFHYENEKENLKNGEGRTLYKYMTGFSQCHNTERLPKEFFAPEIADYMNIMGHNGSHLFLVDDFVRAVTNKKMAPVNPWMSAHYTIAGIYAHKSAMMGGKTLILPEIGEPPADFETISFEEGYGENED